MIAQSQFTIVNVNDGESLYTWIKYADDVNGTNLSDDPTGKAYIGVAYNQISPTESTDPLDYSWVLVKGQDGSQGVQGPPGADGASTYTWIKYADDAVGTNMTDIPDGKMYIGLAFNKSVQTESDVATDYQWSAMYDTEALNSKAEVADMDNLAKIVSDISTQMLLKGDANELQSLTDAYNARVEQDILDKEQLAKDLATIEGRAILAETLAGDNKIVTDFVNTVMTESEEGIYLSNKASSTGILIATDRISFMDNNVEVAYISNQTMQINHGIFVKSATISGYKFECIPNTEILVITWVG